MSARTVTYGRLSPGARSEISMHGLSIADYIRSFFPDGQWAGDRCGCPDDRCRGYHHDLHEECGCLTALIRARVSPMSAPVRMLDVDVNELGVPEPNSAQEVFVEEVAEHAGCPDTTCGEIVICEPCGQLVCRDHTTAVRECVEVGAHHEDCTDDCAFCQDVAAREAADERRAA